MQKTNRGFVGKGANAMLISKRGFLRALLLLVLIALFSSCNIESNDSSSLYIVDSFEVSSKLMGFSWEQLLEAVEEKLDRPKENVVLNQVVVKTVSSSADLDLSTIALEFYFFDHTEVMSTSVSTVNTSIIDVRFLAGNDEINSVSLGQSRTDVEVNFFKELPYRSKYINTNPLQIIAKTLPEGEKFLGRLPKPGELFCQLDMTLSEARYGKPATWIVSYFGSRQVLTFIIDANTGEVIELID